MKRIAVELVPRSEEGLREELKMLKEARLKVDRINIPDLLRCELRSWEGAAIAQEYYPALLTAVKAAPEYNNAAWLLKYQMESMLDIYKRLM